MKKITIAVISIFILLSCKNEKPTNQNNLKSKLHYIIPAKEFKWEKIVNDTSKTFIALNDTIITGKEVIYVINADVINKYETKDKIYVFFNSTSDNSGEAIPTVQCDNCCMEIPEACGGPSSAECMEDCARVYEACTDGTLGKQFCDMIYRGCEDHCKGGY